MFTLLQVLTIILAAIAMAPAVAHALELPGKKRLAKEQYMAMQPIYYPGFTIAGVAEPVGLLAIALLLFVMPIAGAAFWLTAGAFLALLAMHAAYWVLTHPVNKFWLKDFEMKKAGARFFSIGKAGGTGKGDADWMQLRDRWEHSHVVRAGLGFLSLTLLAAASAV